MPNSDVSIIIGDRILKPDLGFQSIVRERDNPPFQLEFSHPERGEDLPRRANHLTVIPGDIISPELEVWSLHESDFVYRAADGGRTHWTYSRGPLRRIDLREEEVKFLEDRKLRQRKHFPEGMYGAVEYTHLRPYPSDRTLEVELSTQATLKQFYKGNVVIIGFFDVTFAKRPVTNDSDYTGKKDYFAALEPAEMTFATELSVTVPNEFEGDDILGTLTKYLQPNGMWHMMTRPCVPRDAHKRMLDESRRFDFNPRFREAFSECAADAAAEFEEHHLPYFPTGSYPEFHPEEGIMAQLMADSVEEFNSKFPTAIEAINDMLEIISWTAWSRGYWPNATAVAVRDSKCATFLREVIRFEGLILNLQTLGYPGMSAFPAGLLRYFGDCGYSTHVIPKDSLSCRPWAPTASWKDEECCGYLHCSARSSTFMRWWTNFWFPTLTYDRGLRMDQSWDRSQMLAHQLFYHKYMKLRADELLKLFPGQNW